jgi:gluconate 2-dehydrogenase gamma chain
VSPAAPPFERRALLDAALARLIPADEHGPGAREAGALTHLERTLTGDAPNERERCERGLAWLVEQAAASDGAPFEELGGARQDILLARLESHPEHGACFELLRRRAIEAFFAAAVGWELIGYPGPRPAWTAREQQLDELPGAAR